MKESISYSFLLNLVILFITVCVAIVMGSLSYYKAYKANKIISETIEKYEGFNCLSEAEIARKLGAVGYITPYTVSCKESDGNCVTDAAQTYKVISYNLDEGMENEKVVFSENGTYQRFENTEKYRNMNSSYKCDDDGCVTNKHYQYGIYTYMYVDAPVISKIMRIPLYTKTSIMDEFRNFYVIEKDDGNTAYIDVESTFSALYPKTYKDGKIYVNDLVKYEQANNIDGIVKKYVEQKKDNKPFKDSRGFLGSIMLDIASSLNTGGVYGDAVMESIYTVTQDTTSEIGYRTESIIYNYRTIYGKLNQQLASHLLGSDQHLHECGYVAEYKTDELTKDLNDANNELWEE